MTNEEIVHRAISILEARLHKPDYAITRPEDASNYLKLQFSDLEYESFRIMLLNSKHELIQFKEMFRGTIDRASVYPREVVKTALHFNAAAVILAHNHPSGHCQPSDADKRITNRLIEALNLIDVSVLDHIVVGGSNTYSFAKHHLI